MAERLALDVSRVHETGILGTKGDDKYPIRGRRITKVEFEKSVEPRELPLGIPGSGRGDAFPTDTDLPDVAVHYWADLGTKLKYSLKIWVEE